MEPDDKQKRAIMAVCLLAAFADGSKSELEHEQIKRIAASLAPEAGFDLPALYQEVLLRRVTAASAARDVQSDEMRQLAYEMAVCVCDADGARQHGEAAFLESLREALGLDAGPAQAFAQQADHVAAAPFAAPASTAASRAQIDSMVLNYSILNGALELLPQSLASMAILPLQTKMVYRIGKAHGYELDSGHIRDFAATLGVGFTGQYVEQFGRKLVGGLLGQLAGGLGGKKLKGLLKTVGGTATGIAFSFATTYALGMVAAEYYAGGRNMSMEVLQRAFAGMFERGRSLQAQYAGQIQARASSLDAGEVLRLVREG
jgi:uncharacterized protein (DUF697 family)/tellurite resistance protein